MAVKKEILPQVSHEGGDPINLLALLDTEYLNKKS
jgi:hypothetical protein